MFTHWKILSQPRLVSPRKPVTMVARVGTVWVEIQRSYV